MQVRFNDTLLERYFTDQVLAAAQWGIEVAQRYSFIINFLTCVDTVGDIRQFTFLDSAAVETASGTRLIINLGADWRLALEATDGAHVLTVTEVNRDNG